MQFQRVLIAAALCSAMGTAKAAQLVQFQAGQPARAAEVNANFKALNDELAEFKTFSNLSTEQLSALKAAVGVNANPYDKINVDCSANPNALVEAYDSQGTGKVHLEIVVKGDCYANFTKQFHYFTLVLTGDPSGAKLIPTPNNNWSLSGGFNGGLYLNNLTLMPPVNRSGVLFSRSSQGSVSNVTIQGGGVGVQVQANAQVYLANVKIRDTAHMGLQVFGGGDLRFLGNNDAAALVDTANGTGVWVEQAQAIFAGTEIKAPAALVLRSSGSVAAYAGSELKLNGGLSMQQGAQLTTPQLAINGPVNMSQSMLYADKGNIVGAMRIYDGSSLKLQEGTASAINPISTVYDEHMIIEATSGSQVTLGKFGNTKTVDVTGYVSLNNAKLSSNWTSFSGDLNMNSSDFVLENGSLNSPGREANNEFPVNINASSSLLLRRSNIVAKGVLVAQSQVTSEGDWADNDNDKAVGNTGATRFSFNFGSSYVANNCASSGYFDFTGASANINDCYMPDSVVNAHTGSKLRMDRTTVGLVHVDSGSVGGFYQSTLTGNGQTSWGDSNYNIGSNSIMYLDNTSLTKAKNFNNAGTLRLQNNTVDMKGSTVECFGNSGHIQWWSTSAASTIGALSGCNAAPTP